MMPAHYIRLRWEAAKPLISPSRLCDGAAFRIPPSVSSLDVNEMLRDTGKNQDKKNGREAGIYSSG